jgi:hypothetical protein
VRPLHKSTHRAAKASANYLAANLRDLWDHSRDHYETEGSAHKADTTKDRTFHGLGNSLLSKENLVEVAHGILFVTWLNVLLGVLV